MCLGGKTVKCETCEGKGYKAETFIAGFSADNATDDYPILKTTLIKVWCEKCNGKGEHAFDGDRLGVGWEGE